MAVLADIVNGVVRTSYYCVIIVHYPSLSSLLSSVTNCQKSQSIFLFVNVGEIEMGHNVRLGRALLCYSSVDQQTIHKSGTYTFYVLCARAHLVSAFRRMLLVNVGDPWRSDF